jgi:hypothetical protein
MKYDPKDCVFKNTFKERIAEVLAFELPKKTFSRLDFERAQKLEIVYADKDCYTDFSKKGFLQNRELIGSPRRVLLLETRCPGPPFTYVVDDQNRAMAFHGFSWGYGGEGLRGLKWLFSQIGFSVDMESLPKPHLFGAWEVLSDGTVTTADFMKHFELKKCFRNQMTYSSDTSQSFFSVVGLAVCVLMIAALLADF